MLGKIISARCDPNYKSLFFEHSPYIDSDLYFFSLGRDALLSGLIELGIQKGDTIIMPAYMCKSSIRPLQSYGFNVLFIDIGNNLELPIDEIENNLIKNHNIKALLVVHYFGFMQNIDRIVNICNEFNVKVIEDSSHSFLSKLIRSTKYPQSDIEIFSMRKSLPVADGGALRINGKKYSEIKIQEDDFLSLSSDLKYLFFRLLEKIATTLSFNIYGESITNLKMKLRENKDNQNLVLNYKASKPSIMLKKYLSNDKYLKDTKNKIINNFNQLIQALQSFGFKVHIESTVGSNVPQACIVYDLNGGLVDYLRSNGIGAWQWPGDEMPDEILQKKSLYPNSIFFDKNIVLIPIHQTLSKRQINYMIKVLSKWKI